MYFRVLLCVFALWGCKSGGDEGPITPPDLQIVSAGSEPRRPLRYRLARGTQQKLEVAVDMEVTAGDMGGPMPTLVLSLTIGVEQVLPVGAQLRTAIVDVSARERYESRVPVNALTGPLESMKGVVIVSTIAPNGRLISSTIESSGKQLPEVVRTQLAALIASFDQLMMPLPDQAVGVGAVWRTSKSLEQQGMKMTAVNSVQLVGVDGDKLTFEIDTEVHGDDQTVKQADLALDVKDITGTGEGKGTLDLRTLALTSELTTEFRAQMQAPGESAPTPMRLSITTRAAPR